MVESITGPEWSGCGCLIASIKWKDGETSNDMVKDMIERKMDSNGFKKAWSEYIAELLGIYTESFAQGTRAQGTQI